MTQEEARAKLDEFRVLDRRGGPPHRRSAQRAHARRGGDRPRQARRPSCRSTSPSAKTRCSPTSPAHNHGPLTPEAVRRIFERIIDEMRTIQRVRMVSPTEDQ